MISKERGAETTDAICKKGEGNESIGESELKHARTRVRIRQIVSRVIRTDQM